MIDKQPTSQEHMRAAATRAIMIMPGPGGALRRTQAVIHPPVTTARKPRKKK